MEYDPTKEFAEYVDSGEAYITDSPEGIVQYFDHGHLSTDAQVVAAAFYQTARFIHKVLDEGPEKSVALRKLLEGKDAAVRSILFETED